MLAARREQKEDLSHRRRDGGHARRAREECLLCATVHPVLSLKFWLDCFGGRRRRCGSKFWPDRACRSIWPKTPSENPRSCWPRPTYVRIWPTCTARPPRRTYVLNSPTNKYACTYIHTYTWIRFEGGIHTGYILNLFLPSRSPPHQRVEFGLATRYFFMAITLLLSKFC